MDSYLEQFEKVAREMDSHLQSRAHGATLRARILHSIVQAWKPLDISDQAYTMLNEMAVSFELPTSELEKDPKTRSFYATLADDMDIAETFLAILDGTYDEKIGLSPGVSAEFLERLKRLPQTMKEEE